MCVHKSLTIEKIMRAMEREMTSLDNPGFCIARGFEQDGCEPDACEYSCESCGLPKVYGAQELLMLMA